MNKIPHMNPNPRIGVLLRNYGASVRLFNLLNPKFGLLGLKRFQREWPDERLVKELYGYGGKTRKEWLKLVANRGKGICIHEVPFDLKCKKCERNAFLNFPDSVLNPSTGILYE